ncbi:NAD-dependent protein deacetylase Sir2B [Babesia sp. Xinjiang]|uniref:NAD-dependent protein deacetylase Sir2B n=1 Tax=Babesia sp. Xinjiang TaxID=462227 RepID=UPI000A2627E1|nr:NAD-dependent protein deacetylase Sir2B [Babesia sp. Xinjiang]ORM40424.1 NAD-dependent protein deacetylase Sir2B [Babesia sp. Xinjiang]
MPLVVCAIPNVQNYTATSSLSVAFLVAGGTCVPTSLPQLALNPLVIIVVSLFMSTSEYNLTSGLCSFPPSGILTDVVLDWFDRYEDHFEKRAISHAQDADFHLTLGSSLHVEPACLYASSEHYRREDAPLVIVNYQKTRLDGEATVVLHCDVNKICTKLVKRLNVQVPPFIRSFVMVGLQYSHRGSNKVILRFPCIMSIAINEEYSVSGKVSHRCLNMTQGMHEFVFTGDFEAVLKLWFDAEMVLKVRYRHDCSLNGLVWRVSLAATDGVYNRRNNTPIVHVFDGDVGDITVARLTLSYNANMISMSDACSLTAVLGSGKHAIQDFEPRTLPESMSILCGYFCGINSSGDGTFESLVDVKEDADWLEKFDTVDHMDLLPEVIRLCMGLGLHRKLGNVCRNQFCIDLEALKNARNGSNEVGNNFSPCNIRLQCAAKHVFGELVDRVPPELRICLPRRIKPIAASRVNSFNPLDALFCSMLRDSIGAILERRVRFSSEMALVQRFKSDFPKWVVCYLADLFECR